MADDVSAAIKQEFLTLVDRYDLSQHDPDLFVKLCCFLIRDHVLKKRTKPKTRFTTAAKRARRALLDDVLAIEASMPALKSDDALRRALKDRTSKAGRQDPYAELSFQMVKNELELALSEQWRAGFINEFMHPSADPIDLNALRLAALFGPRPRKRVRRRRKP